MSKPQAVQVADDLHIYYILHCKDSVFLKTKRLLLSFFCCLCIFSVSYGGFH